MTRRLDGLEAAVREVVIFCGYAPDRAGTCSHHDAFRRHAVAAAVDALQERAIGHSGRREDAVALCHILKAVDTLEILDSPAMRSRDLVLVAEHELPLHLPSDAPKRRPSQHAFGRAAGPHVDIDAGFGIGRRDDSRDVSARNYPHSPATTA